MRTEKCGVCGTADKISAMAGARGKILCATCLEKGLKAEADAIKPAEVERLVDPTLCASCGKDNGEEALPKITAIPVCPDCSKRLRHIPLPIFVGILAVVTLLTVGAAVLTLGEHVVPVAEFRKARTLVRQGNHEAALKALDSFLKSVPEHEQARLMKIEALIDSDQPGLAREEADRFGEPKSEEADRVLSRVRRIEKALVDFGIAIQAFRQGKMSPAVEHINRARRSFPQSNRIARAYLLIWGLYSFDKGDLQGYINAHVLLGGKTAESRMMRALAIAARYTRAKRMEDRELALMLIEEAAERAKGEAKVLVENASAEVRSRLDGNEPRRFPELSK